MIGRSIVQLAPSAGWGGAEQMAETVRLECERAGWRTRLELPFSRDEQWNPAAERRVLWWPWALTANTRGAEIVHAHLPWPDRLGPALVAARGRPLVVTFQLLPPPGGWTRDRCFLLPSKQVLRAAGALCSHVRWVALSRADARTLEPILRTKVVVVRNAPPAPSTTPKPLPWPKGVTRLLSVGRLVKQKGFDAMLAALGSPEVRELPWHWVLIGGGVEHESLIAQAASLGLQDRITFAGARPAIDGFCDADLVLSPSRFEGMPLVPMEAAEAGVAVLASSIDPHRELYESVPGCTLPEDPQRWPSTLARWVVDADHRAYIRDAQRQALGENPRQVMFAKYESLYRELLE